MKTLLLITCSPRGRESNSGQLANYFAQELLQTSDQNWRQKSLNLWDQSLPEMGRNTTSAKYAKMLGNPLNALEQSSWNECEKYFHDFNNADAIVIALPMWNFGVPYVLKHYIDLITQPGLCFEWSPESGYIPLVEPKRCVLVSSSAGDYCKDNQNDFCIPYLQCWLTVYWGYQLNHLTFAPTVASQEQVDLSRTKAYEQADALIEQFNNFFRRSTDVS